MAEVVFTPVQKYKVDKKGKLVLDDNGNKIKIDLYKSITAEEVISFLKENGTKKDIETFKTNIKTKVTYAEHLNSKGKQINDTPIGTEVVDDPDFVNWLYAKQEFCRQFCPDVLPKKEPKKQTILEMLADL